jgi:glucosamine--fructose-6-phosphate aminotransferase (isomerizing)
MTIERAPEVFEGEVPIADKGHFSHFILKEIYEQPRAVGELLRRVNEDATVERFLAALRAAHSLFLVGSGSSFHACLLGSYYFSHLAGKLVIPVLPAQFIEYYAPSLGADTTVVFISQSGETKDVINAVQVARKKGMRMLGITNLESSSLMSITEMNLLLHCGYEFSVAATKTFVSECVLLLYLGQRLAGVDTSSLLRLPTLLEDTLERSERYANDVLTPLMAMNDMYYLGYGITYPIALEGALKLKELTYAHCEGILSSEFKHGPLSAVSPDYPVVFITAPRDVDMVINHINEVTCRRGIAIAVAEEDERLRKNVQAYFPLPTAGQWLNPILATIPLQLTAYRASVQRGLDPDYPRNLSKTLTVD